MTSNRIMLTCNALSICGKSVCLLDPGHKGNHRSEKKTWPPDDVAAVDAHIKKLQTTVTTLNHELDQWHQRRATLKARDLLVVKQTRQSRLEEAIQDTCRPVWIRAPDADWVRDAPFLVVQEVANGIILLGLPLPEQSGFLPLRFWLRNGCNTGATLRGKVEPRLNVAATLERWREWCRTRKVKITQELKQMEQESGAPVTQNKK